MSATHSRRGRILALVAVVSALVVGAVAQGSGPAGDPTKAVFEKPFLTNTVDHHFMGVEMGNLCVSKGRSRKLRDVCSDIFANQSQEIEEMRGFLSDWYGTDKQPEMPNNPLDGDMADMEELETAPPGRSFDTLVSEMFIEHHLLQIARSKRCLRRGEHVELKQLCAEEIDTQTREIGTFERVIRGRHGTHGEGRLGNSDHRRAAHHSSGERHER